MIHKLHVLWEKDYRTYYKRTMFGRKKFIKTLLKKRLSSTVADFTL
jgi:hypothetical protein